MGVDPRFYSFMEALSGMAELSRPPINIPTKISVVDQIVAGIIRQEGEPETSTNPGNIRDPVWFPGAPGNRKYYDGTPLIYANGFWLPRTRQEGVSGLYHVVWLKVAEGYTLTAFIDLYAPTGDENDPVKYVADLVGWIGGGFDPNGPMWNYVQDPPISTT